MSRRWIVALACLMVIGVAVWLAPRGAADKEADQTWKEIVPGVWRSPGPVAGYALVDGDRALLIDAPLPKDGLKNVKTIDAVLLTHHHRDTLAALETYLAAKVAVRAPKASAEWLTVENVAKYWKDSLPLRNSRTNYLVVPAGFVGVDCGLTEGQVIDWHGWRIEVVATPGHARDHVAYAVRKGDGPLMVFCGDALAAPGKIWSPYTTDWDHWTDAGLKPTAESLRKLMALKPTLLLPAHGEVIDKETVAALEKTAAAVEEVAFLKSFERFTKQRLGKAPEYRFLAPDQKESNGSKPWTRVSEHLWITGNTYVLTSKENNAFLVVDPWDKRSADQITKLKADQKLGALEVVMFSHAHFDHYDGIYHLAEYAGPTRDKLRVWTLDQVAIPIADPFLLRAPFLDGRPVKFDQLFKEGETAAWREYRFRFHHLPGQTAFTMGVECEIDGKRCLFTADNWFHQDQFSGSGGWMGLNRSFPLPYARSAQKVLDIAPEWVLAEHGGPFEFSAEDFRRRVKWGEASAKAADAVCVSGDHRHDWDLHRIHVEPLVQKAKPGKTVKGSLVVSNPLSQKVTMSLLLAGRGLTGNQTWTLEVPAGGTERREIQVKLSGKVEPGRHVLTLQGSKDDQVDPSDAFLVIDVEP